MAFIVDLAWLGLGLAGWVGVIWFGLRWLVLPGMLCFVYAILCCRPVLCIEAPVSEREHHCLVMLFAWSCGGVLSGGVGLGWDGLV